MAIQASTLPSAAFDLASVAANVAIFIAFFAAVVVGITKGLKEVRGNSSTPQQLAAATILENVTLDAWTNSNKDVARAIYRLVDTTDDNRRATNDLIEEFRAMRRSLDELQKSLK